MTPGAIDTRNCTTLFTDVTTSLAKHEEIGRLCAMSDLLNAAFAGLGGLCFAYGSSYMRRKENAQLMMEIGKKTNMPNYHYAYFTISAVLAVFSAGLTYANRKLGEVIDRTNQMALEYLNNCSQTSHQCP